MATVPEIGQFTLIRKRPAIVRNLIPFQEPRSANELHMLDVEYIDGLDHPSEDKVIWEREVGAKSYSILDLPDIISHKQPDRPKRYDAFIDAMKWTSNTNYQYKDGKIKSVDSLLLSPWYSAVQVEDYQLYPVLESMSLPRVNLLLADDVGLGKTIEAGLIAQELIRQRRIRRILIVCPSALQIQWKDEMNEKFNIEFVVLDSEQVLDTQRELGMDANPWTVYPKIITSMDYLKQPDILDKFNTGSEHMLPEDSAMLPWDLLIVDEAHNFSPARLSDDSRRCSMLRTITKHFEHRLFLTATPHNGYTQSFSGLLELLDPVRFQQKMVLDDEDFKHLDLVMVRRMKKELNDELGKSRFPERKVQGIPIELTEKEKDLYNAMRKYRENAIKELAKVGNKQKALGGFLFALLTKRLLSSSYSFARTWWNHVAGFEVHEFGFDQAEESRDRAETPVDDDQEKVMRETDALRHGGSWLSEYRDFLQPYMEEVSRSLRSLGWTKEVISHGIDTIKDLPPDQKWESLIKWINEKLKNPDKRFKSDERLILFTEYKDTMDYLLRRFKEKKIDYPTIQTLFGGAPGKHRRQVKEEFNDPSSQLKILLATDAASEGLNLQTSCRYVIHQEVPWNPMRMEQRNGRVDRHGQSRDVFVHHFKSDEIQDLQFLDFIVKKVNHVRDDLGSVGNVLDEAVMDYFETGKDSTEEIDARIDNTRRYAQSSQDMELRRKATKKDYEESMVHFRKTKDLMGLTEERMIRLMSEASKMDEGELVEVKEGEHRFNPTPPKWERLVRSTLTTELGDIHGAKQKMVFSPERFEVERFGRKLFMPAKDKRLVMLGHPLMAKALSSFRRRLWDPDDVKLNRWTIEAADLPSKEEMIFITSLQISARNELGERLKTGILELLLLMKDGQIEVYKNNLDEQKELPSYHVSKIYPRIRQNWTHLGSFIERKKDEIRDQIETSLKEELEKKLKKEMKEQEEMFELRKESLDKEKDPRNIARIKRELEKAIQNANQMTFSEDINSRNRQIVQDLKRALTEEDFERRKGHIQLLKDRLEDEKKRILEKVLPKRYSLPEDGIDIQVMGVKVIVDGGGL